jgi:cysteine synthase
LTEKELSQYRAIKKEIEDLNRRITETKESAVISTFGTVKGSSKYFPYTPQNFKVEGVEPAEATQTQDKVSELLRQREVLRDELLKKQIDIENYIAGIKDSSTRTIFRMYFIDGENQISIARKTHYSQGRIAQIIKCYTKTNKINK